MVCTSYNNININASNIINSWFHNLQQQQHQHYQQMVSTSYNKINIIASNIINSWFHNLQQQQHQQQLQQHYQQLVIQPTTTTPATLSTDGLHLLQQHQQQLKQHYQ